jgi:hypothetical protein
MKNSDHEVVSGICPGYSATFGTGLMTLVKHQTGSA